MDNINHLPPEILERIFSSLNFTERKSAGGVCSYWRSVLHNVRFQRRCRISLSDTFDQELSELELRAVRSYHNIKLLHWAEWFDDDDYDDDYDYVEEEGDEPRKNEDIIHLKYLFEPSPEVNINKILLGHSELKALSLCSTIDCSREILENLIPDMRNLRELQLTFCQDSDSSPHESVWVIRNDKLETLKINIMTDKPFEVQFPCLKKLEFLSNSYSFRMIDTYCWQLQCLRIHFQNPETMDDMMSLSFPKLTHLEVHMYDDKQVKVEYARTRNVFVDKEKEENFVKSMPNLKSITFESNLMFYRIATALAEYSHQLEELTVSCLEIDAVQLQSFRKLPKLKTIILKFTKIISLTQALPKLDMPQLHNLSLLHKSSNVAFDSGLAGLKTLQLTLSSKTSAKAVHKICCNLPNLERLELSCLGKLNHGAFRYLNKLKRLKVLLINDHNNNTYWTHCPVVPTLRRIIFDRCTGLTTKTLQPIARLFPGLASIYLDYCIVTGNNEDDTAFSGGKLLYENSEEAKRKCNEQLKSMLPDCIVSLKNTTLQWRYCE
ncbi:uncharacterized protein LOC128737423 [Sabethes cyaneus]|uniref:uncharacterized protein LOC128737423 n=1 Tax=Sabethes cyaneus TaxID=53552 RepID=UPI00237D4B27|nr:uncharacterized protein LOC128737423 [Sabethes cyaneus]